MKTSAGILLYKKDQHDLYFFLVHPGGPFWKNRDEGAWSIPKGELLPGEEPLQRARTEFEEETGQVAEGPFTPLAPVKQKGGKTVMAWATEQDIDVSALRSNRFDLEWPPKSGKIISVPEVDKWEWFLYETAKKKINPAQLSFLTEVAGWLENA